MSSFFGVEYDAAAHGEDASAAWAMRNSVLDVMKPKASPYRLVRLGGNGDGSYLVPDDLKDIQACFSPGVNNFKNFEDELTTLFGIKCHMCDLTSDAEKLATPLVEGMQTFDKLWLEPKTSSHSISLEDWVQQYAGSRDDLILQIDIEGAEYRNLLNCDTSLLRRFRIIVIELHELFGMLDFALLSAIFYPFFNKIGDHFKCVHAHPNNCSPDIEIPGHGIRVPRVLELTFLRNDRFSRSKDLIAPLLPHPLDVGRSIDELAPLFLDEGWLDGPRPVLSQLKIISDRLDYISVHGEKKLSSRVDGIEAAISLLSTTPVQINELDAKFKDVALGKPYRISSSWGGAPTTGYVPLDENFYFFHTEEGSFQYITIDLLDEKTIGRVNITNRRDNCFERARLLFAEFHNEPEKPRTGETVHIPTSAAFLAGQDLVARAAVPNIRARYVTIFSPLVTILHLSGVHIFAE